MAFTKLMFQPGRQHIFDPSSVESEIAKRAHAAVGGKKTPEDSKEKGRDSGRGGDEDSADDMDSDEDDDDDSDDDDDDGGDDEAAGDEGADDNNDDEDDEDDGDDDDSDSDEDEDEDKDEEEESSSSEDDILDPDMLAAVPFSFLMFVFAVSSHFFQGDQDHTPVCCPSSGLGLSESNQGLALYFCIHEKCHDRHRRRDKLYF
jgi:hypothetical protein